VASETRGYPNIVWQASPFTREEGSGVSCMLMCELYWSAAQSDCSKSSPLLYGAIPNARAYQPDARSSCSIIVKTVPTIPSDQPGARSSRVRFCTRTPRNSRSCISTGTTRIYQILPLMKGLARQTNPNPDAVP
jgi:hypothetical protein